MYAIRSYYALDEITMVGESTDETTMNEALDESLLDATGLTQVLSSDLAVDTSTDIRPGLGSDDAFDPCFYSGQHVHACRFHLNFQMMDVGIHEMLQAFICFRDIKVLMQHMGDATVGPSRKINTSQIAVQMKHIPNRVN